MRRRHPLLLVHDADGAAGRSASGLADNGRAVVCPGCAQRLGIEVHASITLVPTKARRDGAGRLSLDEQQLVCARCRDSGVTTRF